MVAQQTGAQPPEPSAGRPPAAPDGPGAGWGPGAFADWLTARLAAFLQRPAGSIDPRTPFAEYGLDSVAALSLYGDIEEEFALYLEPTVAWDHPSVEALARHLADEYARRGPGAAAHGPAEV
ncbi:acyl carrier protein [Streptomyces albus]|uniref:acyl carrier protein n=1 Tax=Streptomyces TaxID=1883 RepID=UPI0006E3BFD6|nr:acyl carrier protein [Streptomyces albus]